MGLDFLRRMDWLGAARSLGYLRLLAALNIVMLGVLVLTSTHGIDRNGYLLGSDFLSFWTVGNMLQAGSDPYDGSAHAAAQRVFFASDARYTAFFYPPSFLPFCLPLGWLGYFPALCAWLLATGAAYGVALRRWWRAAGANLPFWVAVFAFPAVPIVITHGQTSFLVAGLLGVGAILVRRRPILAGLLMGLATIKPQLGVLVPLALLLTGEWKVIGAAAAGSIGLAAISTLAFGTDSWAGWIEASGRAQDAMVSGAVGYGKMVSTFAALKLLKAPSIIAYAGQILVSFAVVALLVKAAWKKAWRFDLAALTLAGSPLVTPFVLDYDMVLLAFPLLWLTGEGVRKGFLNWEKLAILAAFAAAAFARPLAMNLGIPIMPGAIAGLFLAVWRRNVLTPPSSDARMRSASP